MKLLELMNISKSFGHTKALSGVSFDLSRGEVHCLVGENGAGKSTLIKVLAGIYKPDAGEVRIDEQTMRIDTPNDSERLGISVVHQELMLCLDLTVAENIFLGKESRKGVFLDKRAQVNKAKEVLREIDPTINAEAIVATLSTGKRQVTEIARAVSGGARIVVFDEPTSSLSNEETEKLFSIIGDLRAKGIGVIYISHRMEEIFRLADRVTVLRDGASVGTLAGAEICREKIIAMMVGRELESFYVRNNKPSDQVLFEVKDLSGGIIKKTSFNVKAGEILGFSGLVGAGRTELMRQVFGVDPRDSGTFYMEGKEVTLKSPADAIGQGIAYVPEDRKQEGLFLGKSIGFNMSLCKLDEIIKHLHVNTKVENEIVTKYGSAMKLKMDNMDQEAQALSGGNQQKVLIGRWLAVAKKVLILDEPTRGIDVGAKADIYRMLDELSGKGYGIIIISSELQEIIGMCDRVYVMRDQEIAGCVEKDDISQVSIMNYAMGGTGNE